jgi:tricarballylate dehydrogenase
LTARSRPDVIVVGSGNAGFCAAQAAREAGARVLLLEKGTRAWIGGNTYFTAGAFRTTYADLGELAELVHEPDRDLLGCTDLPAYSPGDFLADLERVTGGRTDPALAGVLTDEAAPAMRWLRELGIRFRLQYDRQSYEVNGRHVFWGNLPVGTVDGGKGLVADHLRAAARTGVEVRCGAGVTALLRDDAGRVKGVRCGGEHLEAGAVILAAGGFQADARLRATYLGPGWDLAKVRGTPLNTGEVLMAALDAGGAPAGHWSGCHATAWDAAAPSAGDRELTNRYTKQSYPVGIVVNGDGERFIDEGADFRNYTYAKYGPEILRQTDARAYQLFDAATVPLLRPAEYEAPGVSRTEAPTIRELAERIGLDPDALERTVGAFNAAIGPEPFDPAVKDGKRTRGLTPPKSNWAVPLERPPFVAFAVTCGITFTFGGVRIDCDGRVLGAAGEAVPGLFAAGEMVGGLFYSNYPGGSGLSAGAVFGRRAGRAAADEA